MQVARRTRKGFRVLANRGGGVRDDTPLYGTTKTALPGCTSAFGAHVTCMCTEFLTWTLLAVYGSGHLGGLPCVQGPHLCASMPCTGRGTWKTQPLCRCPGQVLTCMQEPCLDGHLCIDPVTQGSHCPFRALWTLSLKCPTAHKGPHLGPSTVHRPCPRHTCSARATSASSSGISSSPASEPTWEPRQTLRIWRTVPGALRPDHLQARGSGAWLRGMCTLSTSTVGVSYSISGTYICNHRDTGSISNSTILLFYDIKGSILNFLNPSILFCCFLREP